MEIKKAIITAAGKKQRTLPLQTLVDRDGHTKTALQILIEEIRAAGIEDICVVVGPGDQESYAIAAGGKSKGLCFVEQVNPAGYGHAIHCARDFTGQESFLLLVGDHLYVPAGEKRAAQQLVELASSENCAVSAVQATHESKLPFYGTVGGRLATGRKGIYEITQVVEKPSPTEAEQRLIVPGLRAGNYLCFFGMHVLTPLVMELLGEEIKAAQGPVQLTSALNILAKRERYLASELQARRYDVGVKYGLLTAQMALALAGRDKEEVLASMLELLMRRELK